MDNLEEMNKFLERYFPKIEPERNRKYEQTNYEYWNWISNLKTPKKQKSKSDGFTGEF